MNKQGFNAFHISCVKGYGKCLKLLLENLSDLRKVDDPDRYGFTPLHVACNKGFHKCVNILLKSGCDPNKIESGYHGYSPIHFCARNGDMKSSKLLLKYGADLSIKDKSGYLLITGVASRYWTCGRDSRCPG